MKCVSLNDEKELRNIFSTFCENYCRN